MNMQQGGEVVSREPHKLQTAGSIPAPALRLTSIYGEDPDMWSRALVAVCNVDGSCVDAARGKTANTYSHLRGGETLWL